MSDQEKKLWQYRHPFVIPDDYAGNIKFKFEQFFVFYEAFKDANFDDNLIIHFEVTRMVVDDKTYYEVFIVHKTQGQYTPVMFEFIDDYDDDKMKELLTRHFEVLCRLWEPVSKPIYQVMVI